MLMCEKIEFAPHSQLNKLSFIWNAKQCLIVKASWWMNDNHLGGIFNHEYFKRNGHGILNEKHKNELVYFKFLDERICQLRFAVRSRVSD
jgi:hypothetical protein